MMCVSSSLEFGSKILSVALGAIWDIVSGYIPMMVEMCLYVSFCARIDVVIDK